MLLLRLNPGEASDEATPKSVDPEDAAAAPAPDGGSRFIYILKMAGIAIFATSRGLVSYRRWGGYFSERGLDFVGRTLCAVSLLLTESYNEEDYHQEMAQFFHKEAILSYTVIFLWLRQLKVLTVSRYTGSFVYMLGCMLTDVMRWLLIYFFCAFAWAGGFYVLFRNQVCRWMCRLCAAL